MSKEQIELLVLVWPVLTTVGGFLSKKIYYHITDVVPEKKYDNIDETLFLVFGELIGALSVHFVVFLFAILEGDVSINGKSGWDLYVFLWLVFNVIYVIAITIILFVKMEKGKRKYLENITFAMLISILIAADLYNSQLKNYSFFDSLPYILAVSVIMIVQVIENLNRETVKTVEYTVKVKMQREPYRFQTKPKKIGSFYSAKVLDENKKERKRVLIPETEIEKIEYDIKQIEDAFEERGDKSKTKSKINKRIEEKKAFILIVMDIVFMCIALVAIGLNLSVSNDQLGYIASIIGGGLTLLGVVITLLITIDLQRKDVLNREKHAASILYYDLKSIEEYLKTERSSVNVRYSENWQSIVAECSFINSQQVAYIYKVYDLLYNYNYFYRCKEKENIIFNKDDIPQYKKLKEMLFNESEGYINEQKYNLEYSAILERLKEFVTHSKDVKK